MDPLYDGLQIILSNLSYNQKSGVSNSDFRDTVYDQVITATHQCEIFAFEEHYYKKVLNDNGLTLKGYQSLSVAKSDKYNNLAC